MAKDTSPEEKLLSLIKNKSKKPDDKFESSNVPQASPIESIAAKADERIAGVIKSEIFKSKMFEPARIKKVNRYLILILGLLFLYFVIDLIVARPYKSVQSIIAKSGAQTPSNEGLPQTRKIVVVKDYSEYASAKSRNTVFGKSQGSAGDASEGMEVTGSVSDRVSLVGIIAGDNPQAIIEDRRAQKTYYVNKGESFEGYTVEDILVDKVVLSYEGKNISLFL
jgi:hypothetical protein